MKKYLIFKSHNYILIDFNVILNTIVQNLLNDLFDYQLIVNHNINLNSMDVKKLLYHHTIYQLCEEIKTNVHRYRKIIIVPCFFAHTEIDDYCSKREFDSLLHKILFKINEVIPIMMHFEKRGISFANIETYCEKDTGEWRDINNQLATVCNQYEQSNFSFEKIKKLSVKYQLNFLSKEYFDQIKTKQILF